MRSSNEINNVELKWNACMKNKCIFVYIFIKLFSKIFTNFSIKEKIVAEGLIFESFLIIKLISL